LIAVDDNITSSTYKRIIERHDDTLITLNGWLKIVPPDICESYKIYNGHPALISMYEDLKGKDPVDRLWENYHMYEYAGSVIHEVTADVDEGEIVSKHQFSLVDGYGKHLYNDFERLNSDVRKASLKLWVDFIRDNINI
jgi:folate-dependent phosphoribosylglycinamide formyltransferase PurN